MTKLKIHLVFPGTCEEALNFYKDMLHGEVNFIFRKKEEQGPVSEEDNERISHMVVQTPHFELAGEDANSGEQVIAGNNNKLVLVFQDQKECRRVFDALASKGTVTMPYQATFFCEGMGEVSDQYGISWIIMMTDEGYEA